MLGFVDYVLDSFGNYAWVATRAQALHAEESQAICSARAPGTHRLEQVSDECDDLIDPVDLGQLVCAVDQVHAEALAPVLQSPRVVRAHQDVHERREGLHTAVVA